MTKKQFINNTYPKEDQLKTLKTTLREVEQRLEKSMKTDVGKSPEVDIKVDENVGQGVRRRL